MAQYLGYDKVGFPHFVCNHGNWDIYANNRGYCAAIPTDEAAAIGCKATHFGSLKYVLVTLGYDEGVRRVLEPRLRELAKISGGRGYDYAV